MEIEEIKKVVFEVLKEAGLVKEDKAEVVEEVKEEIKEEVKNEVAVEDKLDDEAEKAEVVEEVKAAEEVKEEVKNEAADEIKEKKEEVIKAEVLNHKPTLGLAAKADADKWRSMNGSEFVNYINSGAYKNDF